MTGEQRKRKRERDAEAKRRSRARARGEQPQLTPRPRRAGRVVFRIPPGMPRAFTGGLCTASGEDPDLWFSEDPDEQQRAMDYCAACPVRMACQQYADSARIEHGIWAGVDRAEAARKRRRRRVA